MQNPREKDDSNTTTKIHHTIFPTSTTPRNITNNPPKIISWKIDRDNHMIIATQGENTTKEPRWSRTRVRSCDYFLCSVIGKKDLPTQALFD